MPLRVLTLSALLCLPAGSFAEPAEPTMEAPLFGDYQASGFLNDYSKIKKTQGDTGSYGYIDRTIDYSKYNKLLVDRIKIFYKDDSQYKGIDPDELKVLTDYFYEAINKAVGDAYPMVIGPGPDVLRVRLDEVQGVGATN